MVVEQKVHPALALLAARPEVLARRGSIVTAWRKCGGKRLGPYYELRYREAGRQRTIYLGRDGPLVKQVRAALAALQAPLRQHRAWQRVRRQACAALRASKAGLGARLAGVGLRLQGWEVRGCRTALLPKMRF